MASDHAIFGETKPKRAGQRAEFVRSNFASKSRIPTGLPTFVDAIPYSNLPDCLSVRLLTAIDAVVVSAESR
jgi:hypothetical protein